MAKMSLWELLRQLENLSEDLTLKELKEIEVMTTLVDSDSNIIEGDISKVTGIWDISGNGTKITLNLSGDLTYRELDEIEISKGVIKGEVL